MFGLTYAPSYAPQLIDMGGRMAVSAAIAYSEELAQAGISVTQECGVIYLDGTVSSARMREEAQKIAADVTGVPVRNRLCVAS